MNGYNNMAVGGINSNVQPASFPYNNNTNMVMNNPYNNYMDQNFQQNQQQRSFNQFLKCRPVSSRE